MRNRLAAVLLAVVITVLAGCKGETGTTTEETANGAILQPGPGVEVNDALGGNPLEETDGSPENAGETPDAPVTGETTQEEEEADTSVPGAQTPEQGPVPGADGGTAEEEETSYEAYHSMTGQEQLAFINSFASTEEFFIWYNKARSEYEALHPGTEIGNGSIDLGALTG